MRLTWRVMVFAMFLSTPMAANRYINMQFIGGDFAPEVSETTGIGGIGDLACYSCLVD